MGRKGTDRLYQFVDDLVTLGARELAASLYIGDEQAREVMLRIAKSICWEYARTNLYVPACAEFELSKRDEEIWADYHRDGDGGTRRCTAARAAELAAKHRITHVQIYNILKLQRRRLGS